MSTSDEYNGYTNRETWAANLHLSNDEGLYTAAREIAQDAIAVAAPQPGTHTAANALREWVEGIIDVNRFNADEDKTGEPTITMMDREVGSWWRVNWQEVAQSFMEEN